MKLIIAEKNDAARQIAERLSTGKPKKDKVYNTAIYRFEWKGEECVTIGLAGHILAPDFCDSVLFDKKLGWYSVTEDGEMLPADMPDGLARPPYDTKRKPFLADGISIKGWKLESLPYLTWAPVIKLPAEKELIRSLKNLAKKSDSVIIATDFDREGELIGSDALNKVREVAPDLPVARAQYSSFTKAEITQAFDNLVSLDQNLADAGESRQHIDLIWGAVLTRYLTLAKFGGFGNVRSAGRVQTPTLALVVERERERMAFVPEDYWQIRGMGAAQGAAEDDRFKIAHKTARFTDKDAAETAYGHVDGATTATVAAVTKRSRKQQPPTPFATTSLQAAAAAEGISPARTMRIAESLYMAGLISYHRVPRDARSGRRGERPGKDQPGAGARVQKGTRRPHEAHARQSRDHRPPAHLPHGRRRSVHARWRPAQALRPHRPPLPGDAYGSRDHREYQARARRER